LKGDGAKTSPGQPAASVEAEAFYSESLSELVRLGIPFLVAATFALSAHTGITRPTKDMDIFCKPGDVLHILDHFRNAGHEIEIEDERWLAKVRRGELFFDLIFACLKGAMPLSEEWFTRATRAELFGTSVCIVGPTELVLSKAFIQLRHRFDGPDIMHVILKQHARIDWHWLLGSMELHWEILFAHLMNFRWIYPAERNAVPRWLMEELIGRLQRQLDMPPSSARICRGSMLSSFDYHMDEQELNAAASES
jgi:hypothetical protein